MFDFIVNQVLVSKDNVPIAGFIDKNEARNYASKMAEKYRGIEFTIKDSDGDLMFSTIRPIETVPVDGLLTKRFGKTDSSLLEGLDSQARARIKMQLNSLYGKLSEGAHYLVCVHEGSVMPCACDMNTDHTCQGDTAVTVV